MHFSIALRPQLTRINNCGKIVQKLKKYKFPLLVDSPLNIFNGAPRGLTMFCRHKRVTKRGKVNKQFVTSFINDTLFFLDWQWTWISTKSRNNKKKHFFSQLNPWENTKHDRYCIERYSRIFFDQTVLCKIFKCSFKYKKI